MSKVVNSEYPKSNKQVSDDQLKAMAAAQYQAGQPNNSTESANKFPTEIVELPSKGLLYSKDSTLSSGKVEMKYMTAKEEDILTTQSYIKQGVVLDKLFKALIVGNGEGKPVVYNDLLNGDKNAVMVAARVLGYGKDYEVTITTPSGEKQKETVDLTSFDDMPFDEKLITPGVNSFEFELPTSKRKVTFKVLSHRDQNAIDAELKGLKKLKDGYGSKELTTRLIHSITSIDGEEDRSKIRNFVKNELLAIDSRALRTYIKNVSPDINLKIEIVDQETGEPFDMDLPIDVSFFWPQS